MQLQGQAEDAQEATSTEAWPSSWVSARSSLPSSAHLTLELVCMKGPDPESTVLWLRSHSASDAVHVVIVVDSLDAEA